MAILPAPILTGGLLVALSLPNIFIFTPDATGAASLIYGWLLSAAMWLVVAAVALANRGVR